MGRRAWAIIIVAVLLVVMSMIMVVKSQDLFGELGAGGTKKWQEQTIDGSGKYKIVRLEVNGTIAEHSSFSSSFSAEQFVSQLDQAKKDKDVKAVVIRVTSPGGEVVASDEIHQKIEEVKRAGKTVVVSMGSMAASGGYYIATAADRIFANPSTITGSLGVIFSLPNYEKAAEWIGYKQNTIKSGDYKDIGSPLREMSPNERDIFQRLVDDTYEQFVTVIVQGRKLDREEVLKIADGRVYSGKQAKELKLIDEFGSLEDATAYAMKQSGLTNAKIVKYTEKFSLASIMSGGLSQQANSYLAQFMGQVLPHSVTDSPQLMYLFEP
jgi:protease-4